jgi:outer membrane lipoprotein-sorting protein
MKIIASFLFSFLLMAQPLFAKDSKSAVIKSPTVKGNKEHKRLAIETLEKYASAKTISADLEKLDHKLTLGTKTTNKGTINYSAGKVYLKLESDKKTELFFKDNKITLVDYPDQDFDKSGPRKVTTITKDKPAFLQSLINLFSNSGKFFSEFKIKDSNLSGDQLVLNLEPTIKTLKNFVLTINTKAKTIDSVQFTDDVETQTTITFKNLQLNKKLPKGTFDFKSLKSDQEMHQ